MATSKTRSRSSSSSSRPGSTAKSGSRSSGSKASSRHGRSQSASARSGGKTSGRGGGSRSSSRGQVRGAGRATIDHDQIRQWVESRGGSPACVKGTGGRGDPGMLRIDFPGFSGEDTLQHIGWDEFFDAFEANNLAFLFQDQTKSGGESRFFKLIDRGSVSKSGSKRGKPGSSKSRRSSSSHGRSSR